MLASFIEQLSTLTRSSFAVSALHLHPFSHLDTFWIHIVLLQEIEKAVQEDDCLAPSMFYNRFY